MLVCFPSTADLKQTVDKVLDSEDLFDGIFTVSPTSNSGVYFVVAKSRGADLSTAFPSHLLAKIFIPQNLGCQWDLIFNELSTLISSHQVVVVDDCEEWANLLNEETKSKDWKIDVYSLNEHEKESLYEWNTMKASIKSINHKSYRDVLMTIAACESKTVTDVPKDIPLRNEWKPKILVSSASQVQTKTAASSGDYCEDDDWELNCNAKFSFQSAVLTKRKQSIARMRPAQIEQKLKRIAMKQK